MTDFTGQRVLVTGAGGFIGSHLVRRLIALGADVHAIRRRSTQGSGAGQPRVILLDIGERDALMGAVRATRPKFVFHAAASRAEEDWQSLAGINVLALMTLLDACVETRVQRLITLGSSLELLDVPPSAFAASRSAGALMMRYHAEKCALPLTHIRSGYVYGPGMSAHKFIPSAIRAGLAGTEIPITPDDIKRNYIHVDDVIDACIAAARLGRTDVQAVNAVAPEIHSARDVTTTISAIIDKPVAVKLAPGMIRNWDRGGWAIDPVSAAQLGGWRARVALRQGLETMVDHERGCNAD